MIKVDGTTNNLYGMDQSTDSTGNSLEAKPTRPSPFSNFHGWGSDATKTPKPTPPMPKPVEAPKPIDTHTAIGAAFKKASDAMVDSVRALEKSQQERDDIQAKAAQATMAKSELAIAIASEAALRVRLHQTDNPEKAIYEIVSTFVGGKKVDAANEVLFRSAATQALQSLRSDAASKR